MKALELSTPSLTHPPSHYTVLLVDDEADVAIPTAAFLGRIGYRVRVAGSAREALIVLGEEPADLMLCDVRMPEISGLDLLPRARALDPVLAIVMMSGVNDAVTARSALHLGAVDYLVKPVALAELSAAVLRALQRREEVQRRRRANRARRSQTSLQAAELEAERLRLAGLTVGIVESLIVAMEAKDPFLRGRSERVADIAGAIAEELGLAQEAADDIRLAARVHDVGMLGIRESVLSKPGALTDDEFEHVKDHVRIGMEILTPLDHLGSVLDYVQDHHERWDGTGYPRRICGESISIGGRVLAAADAYESLTSGRAFRRAASPLDALDTIRYVTGELLDPAVYAALCAVVHRAMDRAGGTVT